MKRQKAKQKNPDTEGLNDEPTGKEKEREDNPYYTKLREKMLGPIQQGKIDPFPKMDKAWFLEHGSSIPAIALKQYTRWRNTKMGRNLSPTSVEALRRNLIQMLICAVGVKYTTADIYLRGEDYSFRKQGRTRTRFSSRTLTLLNDVTSALGYPVPDWSPHTEDRPWSGRLAIFTELSSLPSQRYHFDLIRAIAHEARNNHCLCSVHEVTRDEPARDISQVMCLFDPDAAVLLRITPNQECLDALGSTPTILVHADRRPGLYEYPPIACNIVPNQRPIKSCLKEFIDDPDTQKYIKPRTAVVCSVDREGTEGSIRDVRIGLVLMALEELHVTPTHCIVPDYSFSHAVRVFQAFPDTDLYVCLSDQLAVGIKHCLMASGREYKRRVVGWDNSRQYAQAENITSFDQGLEEIAGTVFEKLIEIVRKERRAIGFRELGITVRLQREKDDGYPDHRCKRRDQEGIHPTFDLK